MSKIFIHEVDQTTTGIPLNISPDVAFVPGFSTKLGIITGEDNNKLGRYLTPVLCRNIKEFEEYFGTQCPTFMEDQPYPEGFDPNGFAVPKDKDDKGDIIPASMFKKGDADPSYIYAKELISAGIPIIYCKMNESDADINVATMYKNLEEIFNTTDKVKVDFYDFSTSITPEVIDMEKLRNRCELGVYTLTYITVGETSGWAFKGSETIIDLEEYGLKFTVTSAKNRSVELFVSFELYEEQSILLDRGAYDFKFLTSGGYPTYEYKGKALAEYMATVCAIRGDAVALIDHTDNPQRPFTGVRSVFYAINNDLKLSPTIIDDSHNEHHSTSPITAYAAMFTPYIDVNATRIYKGLDPDKLEPKNLGTKFSMPASFAYLYSYAVSIKINSSWQAIAGAIRGKVNNLYAVRSEKLLTNTIADAYSNDTGVAINPITEIKPYGQCIFGNRTLLDNANNEDQVWAAGTIATSFLNIRSMMCDLKKQIYSAAKSLIFEQNSDILWINFCSKITPLLDNMKSGYGISNYKIIKVAAESTRKEIVAKIRIYPIYAVESFDVTIYLNDQESWVNIED